MYGNQVTGAIERVMAKRVDRVDLRWSSPPTLALSKTAMPAPQASIVYATLPGGTTLDQDACGGNPFATALIELSQRQALNLRQLLPALRKSTIERSARHQVPTWERLPSNRTWTFPMLPGTRAEKRIALVLIVSEYLSLANPRLLGAAADERRIASMLAGHGFSVVQAVPPDRQALHGALRSFAAKSKGFDVAVVYSTGHGVEHEGSTYLLPGDYPFLRGYGTTLLAQHAVPVDRIASACKAKKVNLTFFAGCRTNT